MKTARTLLALSLASLGSVQAPAGLIFFTREAAFATAAPGLAVQDFSAAIVPADNALPMGNSLESATNNGIFSPGDILPGFSISATGSDPGLDLAITGVGFFPGMANKAVFANNNPETLNVNFGPGQTAVSLGLLSGEAPANFTLSFFSPANGLLGTTTVHAVPATGSGLFFGVLATAGDTIGRINLSSDSDRFEGVDRVQFAAPAAVPEPGTALAGLLALGLCAFGRRRRRASRAISGAPDSNRCPMTNRATVRGSIGFAQKRGGCRAPSDMAKTLTAEPSICSARTREIRRGRAAFWHVARSATSTEAHTFARKTGRQEMTRTHPDP